MYTIEYAEGVADDLKKLRTYERKRIVDEAMSVVFVRAIRHKPPHKTTEEIL